MPTNDPVEHWEQILSQMTNADEIRETCKTIEKLSSEMRFLAEMSDDGDVFAFERDMAQRLLDLSKRYHPDAPVSMRPEKGAPTAFEDDATRQAQQEERAKSVAQTIEKLFSESRSFRIPLSRDENGYKIEITVDEDTLLRGRRIFQEWANQKWPEPEQRAEALRGAESTNMVIDGLLRSGALGTSIEDSLWQQRLLRESERAPSALVDALRDEFCPNDAKAIRQANPGNILPFPSEENRKKPTASFGSDLF